MMIKVIKTLFGISLLTIITLFVFCLIFFYKKTTPALQCHANIRYNTMDAGQVLRSNINVDVYFNVGYISVTGDIQLGDTQYFVRRDIYSKKEGQSGAVVLTKEIILPGDDVNNALWEHFFIPRPYNIPFFAHFKKLTGNLYYISLSSSPYFICAGSD